MKRLSLAILIICFSPNIFGQFYLRGEIRDSLNNPLSNARIVLASSGTLYMSGPTGGFGISSKYENDTLFITKDGYISQAFAVNAKQYLNLRLRMTVSTISGLNPRLISMTTQSKKDSEIWTNYAGETYRKLIENEFTTASNNPETIFSLRIDKAAYSNVRRILNQNEKVPPDAIRIEEMLNYFTFNYRQPDPQQTFDIQTQITDCPWDQHRKLVFINVNAQKIRDDAIPPSNLVFLIDVSASMDQPNRLPLIKESLQLLVKNLRIVDTVSIVVYGGDVGVWLAPTDGSKKEKILAAIEKLKPGGDTPGEDALKTAYMLARKHFIIDGNNRIILTTDGDFNVGTSSEKKLEELIGNEKQYGISLTCIGVGMGNYKDSKIEILAKKGNGNFAYIDSLPEAEKIFLTEFTQTIYSVAKNVKVSVFFDSMYIQQYRLIGYENKNDKLNLNSRQLEGGEIGSGSSNMIVFEVIMNEKVSQYQKIGAIHLQYQYPQDTSKQSLKQELYNNFQSIFSLPRYYRVASTVTMFALKLRQSKFCTEMNWDSILGFAQETLDPNIYLEDQLLRLINKAKLIDEALPKKIR